MNKNAQSIKPEMHDIGKLIDSFLFKHNFEDYPGKLSGVPEIKQNPVWEGIIQHHCTERDKEYPKSFSTFVLSIADSVASATSRHVEARGKPPRYNVYKLWRPPAKCVNDLSEAIGVNARSPKWVSNIVNFVNKNPSVEEFFKIFGKFLKIRAEDATPGSNITSLWTHSKLTALIYNFLLGYLEKVSDEWFKIAAKEDIKDYIRKIQKNTNIKIVRIKINFPQNPVRVRDLNVFDVLKEIKSEILEKYPNNVLFIGFDEMLMITPINENFEEIRKIVARYGFWVEFTERIQNLDQPYPDPEKPIRQIKRLQRIQQKEFERQMAKIPPNKRRLAEEGVRKAVFEKGKLAKEINRIKAEYFEEVKRGVCGKSSIYAELPEKIDPPICELCQMKKASERWEDVESGITELLCTDCFNIRKRGAKFPKLDDWEKEGADRVLWIKIHLDMNELINVLEELYAEYLRELGIGEPEKRAEIRFSVLSEFDWDYREFLEKFKRNIIEKFGGDNVQEILEEFISVRIDSLRDIRTMLGIFNTVFTEVFPKFKEKYSPIKLGIVCAGVKHPFLECWRILSNLRTEVKVAVIGKGEINLNISQLDEFLEINVRNKALLHKFTSLSEISHRLAEVTLYDREDRDYRRYKSLREAVKKFGFQNVLTYAKIMGD